MLAPRAELGSLSWQSYLRGHSREAGIVVECTRALTELRDMVELYARSKPFVPLVVRLEEVRGAACIAPAYAYGIATATRAPNGVARTRAPDG